MKKNVLGIIGGMGPEASAYFYTLLNTYAVEKFGARHNDDFPEIILHSVPVPDFISSDKNKKIALQMLQERVKILSALPLSCLSIACNTAHTLLPELQKQTKVPFISMIDEVVKQVSLEKKKVVGLLATPSTIRFELYQSALKERNILCLLPNKREQRQLEVIIRHILAGKYIEKDQKILLTIARRLSHAGAEGIILGCTELPLLFPQKTRISVYSSLHILAKRLLRIYYERG